MPWLTTIGLEVHVQLKTQSKMFCACATAFGSPPNSQTCPTCLGLPGSLPVVNEEALRLTVRAGLMLGSEIPALSRFDRKNYFYPDMPKNYQISQYEFPLCLGGRVPLPELAWPKDAREGAVEKSVPLVRIHLEEDVAKSFHFPNATGVDFNRAGLPLMEIVSAPELESPEEAFAFLTSLRQILVHGGISDADMEKGQLRCDCNVSVRPAGQAGLGAKIEIKNMNSISGVRRALTYEIERQQAALADGETLSQETRGWDDAAGRTFLMRTKESAQDYHYFPEPDLVPLQTATLVEAARRDLPELPAAKRERFIEAYGITPYDAGVLADDPALASYFEKAASGAGKAKTVANWVLNDLQSALAAAGQTITDCPVAPESLGALVELVESGRISGRQGKEVFAEMFAGGRSPAEIVAAKGLTQVTDRNELEALCDQVIAAHPKPVADFRAGNVASLNFLKGQAMKLSQGRANPALLGDILREKLSS